jgi:hypothetical protein
MLRVPPDAMTTKTRETKVSLAVNKIGNETVLLRSVVVKLCSVTRQVSKRKSYQAKSELICQPTPNGVTLKADFIQNYRSLKHAYQMA